jgi:putative protease
MPADLHKVRPHQALNRNLDHNWQQALLKTSSERRIAVDINLSGWQEQLVLTMTCEDGVSVTHTWTASLPKRTRRRKRWRTCVTAWQNWGRPSIMPAMCRSICRALFVPNSLLNQLRRETAEWMATRGTPPRGSASGFRAAAGLPGDPSLLPRQRL